MSGISQLREKYPQYNDLSDRELAEGFRKKYYSDIKPDEYYEKMGISSEPTDMSIPQTPSPKEEMAKTTEDVAQATTNAILEGPKSVKPIYTMDDLDTNQEWINSPNAIYQSEKGPIPIEMQRDPALLAQWLKERHSEIGWSLANVAGKGIAETALTTFDMTDDAKKAWVNSLNMYEDTESDFGSALRATGQVFADPTTYASLIFGLGLGGIAKVGIVRGLNVAALALAKKELTRSLKKAGYKAAAVNAAVKKGASREIPAEVLTKHIKSAALKTATKQAAKAGGASAAYTGAFDASEQQFQKNIDKINDFDFTQFGVATGIGGVTGLGLVGVGKLAGKGIRGLRGRETETAQLLARQTEAEKGLSRAEGNKLARIAEAEDEAVYKAFDPNRSLLDSRGRLVETVGNANTFLGRLLTSAGALPKELADAGVKRQNIQALETEGKALFKVFKKDYNKLNDQQKQAVNKYLDTGVDDGTLPDNMKVAADNFTTFTKRNEKLINQAAGFKGNARLGVQHKDGEAYFTRFYEAENNPAYLRKIRNAIQDKGFAWGKEADPVIAKKIEDMRTYLEKIGITDTNIQNEQMEAMLRSLSKSDGDLFSDVALLNILKDSAKGTSSTVKNLRERKDLDPRVRQFLGEVDDPLKRIQKTINTQARVLGQAEYLRDVDNFLTQALEKDGLVVMGGLFPKLPTRIEKISQKPASEKRQEFLDEFVRQNLGSRADNAAVLQSMYMSPAMASYIKNGVNLFDTTQPTGRVMGGLQNLAAIGQASQTIFDIPAYALNAVGAVTMATANGHVLNQFAYKAATRAIKDTVQQLKLNDEKAIAKIELLKRTGVIDSDLTQELVIRNINQSLTNPKNIFTKGYKKVYETAGKAYGQPDTFSKFLAFESELNSVRKMFPDLAEGELEKLAIDRVRATMPTYNAAVPIARQLSRLPIGTYALFPSEIVRTTKNIVKIGASDVRDGIKNKNPAQIRAGLNRLTAFGAVTAGTEALINSNNEEKGVDQQTANALELVMAPWYKNTVRQHNTGLEENEQGEIITNFRNSAQYDAYDFAKQPIRFVLGNILSGRDVTEKEIDDAFTGLIGSAVGPYTNPKFLTQALLSIANTNTRDEGGIYSTAVGERGLSEANAKAAMEELLSALEPGTSQIIRQYITSLNAEEWAKERQEAAETNKGFPLETKDILWHAGTGIKPQTMNIDKSIGFNVANDVRAIKATGSEFINYLRNLPRETYTPERRQEILDRYRYYQDLKYKGMQDLAGKIDRVKQIRYKPKGQDELVNIDEQRLVKIITGGGWYPKAFQGDVVYAGFAGDPVDLGKGVLSREGLFMPDNVLSQVFKSVARDKAFPKELLNDLGDIQREYAGLSLRPQAEKQTEE